MMTDLLARALRRIQALEDRDQDAMAAMILDALDDEARWSASFARSQDVLATMADDALAEHKRGLTQKLDPEKM